MSRKHRKKQEPSVKSSVNSRSGVHKYFRVDDAKSIAFQGGRCSSCGKITLSFCDRCGKWACEKHLSESKGTDVCRNCMVNEDRQE